jgi:ubiquinone/menaquinone biosynthesis C-methylase UbiE
MNNKHLFPWWAGYMLISPLRRLSIDPELFLRQYIEEGMTVIDAGCAMGFFSIPAGHIVGKNGKVLCVDLQERMLRVLGKRAVKHGVDQQVITRKCSEDRLMIEDFYGMADVAIAFGVVHEVPDEKAFLGELSRALKPGGILIMGEPCMPVPENIFRGNIMKAGSSGLREVSVEQRSSCRIAILRKE